MRVFQCARLLACTYPHLPHTLHPPMQYPPRRWGSSTEAEKVEDAPPPESWETFYLDHPLVPLDYHTIGKAIQRAGAASQFSEEAGPFRVLIGHGIYR